MSADTPSTTRKPAIVSPVMRHLTVADADRSVAFYRDVLGFEARDVREETGLPAVAEVVYGPARVQFDSSDRAAGESAPREPQQAAIVFFETDDVEAMRAAIVGRGGKATRVERVNWIKMDLFEVHDPDGHTLWFGRSFDEPDAHQPSQTSMLERIMPELPLTDVPAGVVYYRDVLGFEVNYQQHDLGVMDRDGLRLLLIARTERHTGIGSAGFYVRDADALHAELSANGANVQGEPISHPWGLRDFAVLDPEGNRITFAQTFE